MRNRFNDERDVQSPPPPQTRHAKPINSQSCGLRNRTTGMEVVVDVLLVEWFEVSRVVSNAMSL